MNIYNFRTLEVARVFCRIEEFRLIPLTPKIRSLGARVDSAFGARVDSAFGARGVIVISPTSEVLNFTNYQHQDAGAYGSPHHRPLQPKPVLLSGTASTPTRAARGTPT